jgi:hypothetical protein
MISIINLMSFFLLSSNYAPVSRSGAYDLPVTARRTSPSGNQNGLLSNIASVLSSPSQLFSTVQSQLTKGYESVKDRVCQLTGYHQASTPGSPSRGITSGGTRFSRTSSQSSGSGSKAKGYNLRSRPVHSTPRDTDTDQHGQRKTTTKHRKEHHEEDDDNLSRPKYYWKKFVDYSKKLFHSPIDILDTVWNKLKLLPLWLLIPLLLLLLIYACKLIFDLIYFEINFFFFSTSISL